MTIKIVTDSTSDLSEYLIKQHGITVVPLSISLGEKTYIDGVDLSKKEFIRLLTSSDELPKSSQPSAGTFEKTYRELLDDPNTSHVLSIHLTEGMSGTVNAAQTASGMIGGGVTVVNSSFISHALGFQVLEAAAMAKNGHKVSEIVEHLEQVRQCSSLYLMVDTLQYLAKGGRIGRGKALLGSLLKIKPIASLADGIYTPVTKVRTHMQMIEYFTKTFKQETEGKTIKAVGIAQVEAEGLAHKLREALQRDCEMPFVTITETSPIISTHTGPGALALMYYAIEE